MINDVLKAVASKLAPAWTRFAKISIKYVLQGKSKRKSISTCVYCSYGSLWWILSTLDWTSSSVGVHSRKKIVRLIIIRPLDSDCHGNVFFYRNWKYGESKKLSQLIMTATKYMIMLLGLGLFFFSHILRWLYHFIGYLCKKPRF